MESDKVTYNDWLILSQLVWFVPICYNLCVIPLNLLRTQQIVESLFMTLVGILCIIFYKRKIGRITALICLVMFIVMLLWGVFYYVQDDVLSSIFFSMIPSFRIVILMDIVMMLGVPLSLIFHKQIIAYKRGDVLSATFSIIVLSMSVYSAIWTYIVQDKLACEKYKECKELVTQIEDYKKDKGRYPLQLSEIDMTKKCTYELSQDGNQYKIVDMFEHWHDRCYTHSPTFSLEVIIYDSETQNWIRE